MPTPDCVHFGSPIDSHYSDGGGFRSGLSSRVPRSPATLRSRQLAPPPRTGNPAAPRPLPSSGFPVSTPSSQPSRRGGDWRRAGLPRSRAVPAGRRGVTGRQERESPAPRSGPALSSGPHRARAVPAPRALGLAGDNIGNKTVNN